MAEHSVVNSDLATQPDTRIGTPTPKTDAQNSAEEITRVNSNTEKKNSSEKQENVVPVVNSQDAVPSTILTGSKLALAHVGFLL